MFLFQVGDGQAFILSSFSDSFFWFSSYFFLIGGSLLTVGLPDGTMRGKMPPQSLSRFSLLSSQSFREESSLR